jgi:hypothetical protein
MVILFDNVTPTVEYSANAELIKGFATIIRQFRDLPLDHHTAALLTVLIDIIHEVSNKEGKI